MSLYNSLYEREGHGISPNEPEKKGFARFCQINGSAISLISIAV